MYEHPRRDIVSSYRLAKRDYDLHECALSTLSIGCERKHKALATDPTFTACLGK